MTPAQRIILFALGICVALGCASATSNLRKYSQAQLTALTSRNVDGTFDETYTAALDALFDSGYTIEESDKSAGIMTGFMNDDRSNERAWVSAAIADKTWRISVLVRKRGPHLVTVRLSTSLNGEQYVDEKAINEFWNKMKRQVMIQEPAPVPPTNTNNFK